MKKILTTLSAFVLTLTCMFCFAGCGGGATQLMSVSMNPSVIFGVNGDKITSVQYQSEETEQIFSMVKFEGKTLQEAADIFVEMSLITGHLNGNISISTLGSDAAEDTALLDTFKAKLEASFDKLGMTPTINLNDVTDLDEKREYLEMLYQSMNTDKTQVQIDKMSNQDLISYYENGVNQFKDITVEQLNQLQNSLGEFVTDGMRAALTAFNEAYDLVKDLAENVPDSVKQPLQQALNEAEAELKQVLNQVKQEQNRLLNLAKQAAAEAKEAVKTAFKAEVAQYKASITSHLDEKLAAEDITQEYYDHLVALMNQYSPAA